VPTGAGAVATRPGRIVALDGVRGIAASAVLVFHVSYGRRVGGALGVDAFFVLSGFLITNLLIGEHRRTGTLDLLRFWARRATRLWPPLAVFVLFTLAFTSDLDYGHSVREYLHEVFAAGTWSMDALATESPAIPRHLSYTWTLAIEEQFYLVWPVVFLFLLRRRVRATALVGGLLVAALASWAGLMLAWHDTAYLPAVYTRPDTRAYAVLIGCALAIALDDDRLRAGLERVLRNPLTGWIGAALVLGAFLGPSAGSTTLRQSLMYGAPAVTVGTAALIGHAALRGESLVLRVLGSPPLRALGAISYSLYLVQQPVLVLVQDWTGRSLPGSGSAFKVELAGLAVLAAIVLWYVVERPATQLAHRIGARPDETSAAPARARWRVLGAVPVALVAVGCAVALLWPGPTHLVS
jgi:peptidoglycan/LPS O-acetylase OafA/YrhL